MTPIIGQAVQVSLPPTDSRAGQVRAAIIIGVNKAGNAEVHVFGHISFTDERERFPVWVTDVPFAATPTPGHWNPLPE